MSRKPTRKNSRTANNSGSIRQRPDGRWEARVTIGTNPGTGKPVRRSFYGDTQKEVRAQMTAALSAIDAGTYQTPKKLTLGAWLDEWFETFCRPKVKPLTLASYEKMITNHIKPRLGAMQLQAVRGTHVQKLYTELRKSGRKVPLRDDDGNIVKEKGETVYTTGPLSPKTVTNVAAILHKAFDVAIKQGFIQHNPCEAAELPKAVKHEIKPLTDEEIPRFLAALKEEPMGNAYALCLFAGLREGECLGLSWDQVDIDKGRITIKQQLQREKTKGGKYYIAPFTKSTKPRIIEPPAIAFDYLREEKKRQNAFRLRLGAAWKNPDNLVFTNELGEHLKIFTFYSRFKKIAASIGRPDARPHDLRHTAATVAIASGADIKSVQDLLGHATASFTLNVYAHTSEQMMRDTAARVQGYYDSLTKQG